jgi:type IX secretion system PorP/SprF family membrane protein
LIVDLGENLKFKPTMLTKATFSSDFGAPVQLDLTASFLIKERFWLGAMYRTGDSFGFIAQWIIDKKMRIGYAYDYTTSNLQNFHSGSHEIMVSYELRFLKEMFASPRYF